MRDGPVSSSFLWSLRTLLMIAAGVSTYLLYQSLSGASVAGCGPGSGCGEVLSSRWASWLGVPVSVGGLSLYAAMLIASFCIPARCSWDTQRIGWTVLLAGAIIELVAAGWFIGVQAIDLGAFCPWCMSAHATAGIAAILILLRAPISSRFDPSSFHTTIKPSAAVRAFAIGLLCAAAIPIGQLLYVSDGLSDDGALLADAPDAVDAGDATSDQQASDDAPIASGPTVIVAPGMMAAENAGTSRPLPPALRPQFPATTPTDRAPRASTPTEKRIIRILKTRDNPVGLAIDLHEVPVLGSPEAPQYLVKLFDYTCPACRKLHGILEETRPRFADSTVVVLLPTPLLHDCNPVVPDTAELRKTHAEACGVARAALAVWKANPSQFARFHQWAFEDNWPPTEARAKAKASELIGESALDETWNDPWIAAQLKRNSQIFASTIRATQHQSMPKMIFETRAVSGVPRSAAEMLKFLSEAAGIKLSPPTSSP